MSKYDDIIQLNKPKSRRIPMPITNRTAQFAPFSALSGYEDAIKEVSRITCEKHELSEGRIDIINNKLNEIKNHLNKEINITYFVKDKKKSGGEYVTKDVVVIKVDDYKKKLICLELIISFDDIFDIRYK